MDNSRDYASPSHDEFLAAILGEDDPADTAAFVATILGECEPASTAMFADVLREYNPDEPRDERGRWTTGGTSSAAKLPAGTKENGYKGLGTWEGFKTEEEFFDFLRGLLGAVANNLPEGWEKVARRGCIGLNMLRIGWGDLAGPPLAPFLYRDAEYYTDRGTAEARLRQLQGSQPGKEWLLDAAQVPLKVPAQGLVNKFGENKVDIARS